MMRLLITAFILVFIGCGLRPPPTAKPKAAAQNPGAEKTDVLIYGGVLSWNDEIDSIKGLLTAQNKTYVEYNDAKMNSLSLEDLKGFSLVIFPGGNSDRVSENLTPETKRHLRDAIVENGLNYLGLCAGAWLVISPEPIEQANHYGFQLQRGPWLQQTSFHHEKLEFKIVQALLPGGVSRRLLWFGGPITPEIPGGVIARYSDGSPAATQMRTGKGFVIISGLHPTANKEILKDLGLFDREAIAPELAWTMIEAALYGKPMAAFPE